MPPETERPVKGLRVLLIEDNALIGALYADVLAEMGHSVCATETTEADAVRAAAQHKPDLMIVDASLGEGSGIAAVQEILRGGFIPHVFVGGNIDGVKASMPGAIVIQKPFREPELALAIQRAFIAN